jgi:hypothetical protein
MEINSGSDVGPTALVQLVRRLRLGPIGAVHQLRDALLCTAWEKKQSVDVLDAEQDGNAPLRRNMRVADACERMWPPMGFSAPPATNVMVAPGSASTMVSMGNEDAMRNAYTALGSSSGSPSAEETSAWFTTCAVAVTLYSSESLVNFDSICPSWRAVSRGTPDRADECTFCCRSLSSPRPEKSVRKSAIMLSTIWQRRASARAAPNEDHKSHEQAEVLVLREAHRTLVDELHLVLAVPRPGCRGCQPESLTDGVQANRIGYSREPGRRSLRSVRQST